MTVGDGLAADVLIDDRFRLLRKLGQGGFGVVWSAEDRVNGGHVALKFPVVTMSASGMKRFVREAEVLMRLRHPGIIAVHHLALSHTPRYFAMELVRGRTLFQDLLGRSAAGRLFALDDLAEIFGQVCSAVTAAHEADVLHRDLKPANILLADGPKVTVKVFDFGIAKLLDANPNEATTQGRLLGSRMYISPESLTGLQEVDERIDVFSLGCILYEMITLRRPWVIGADGQPARFGTSVGGTNNSWLEILSRMGEGAHQPPSQVRPGLSGEVDDLVRAALAPHPRDRIASPKELEHRFAQAVQSCDAEQLSAAVAGVNLPRLDEDLEPIETTAAPDVAPTKSVEVPPTPTRIFPQPDPPSASGPWSTLLTLLLGAVLGASGMVIVGRGTCIDEPTKTAASTEDASIAARSKSVAKVTPSATQPEPIVEVAESPIVADGEPDARARRKARAQQIRETRKRRRRREVEAPTRRKVRPPVSRIGSLARELQKMSECDRPARVLEISRVFAKAAEDISPPATGEDLRRRSVTAGMTCDLRTLRSVGVELVKRAP